MRNLRRTTLTQFVPSNPMPGDGVRGFTIHTSIQIGRFLITPMTRPLSGGRYAAAVSIRSGRGSMTHDRVMRFTSNFDSDAQAARYATQQALDWVEQRDAPSPMFS